VGLSGEFDPKLKPNRRLRIEELNTHVFKIIMIDHDDEVVDQVPMCLGLAETQVEALGDEIELFHRLFDRDSSEIVHSVSVSRDS
jgi:hypothetical protein